MAELNLKQIADKLNAEFVGETRKLVFWYDAGADFADQISGLELDNAKILMLEPDNQFYTKYFLERVDTTTNYLVYAPFAKPALCDNHLADTIRYSKEFFADRISLICVDLSIPESLKAVLQKYASFFKAQDRTDRFYKLEIDRWTQEAIEVGLMSVLCRVQALNFEEVVRIVLTGDGFVDNKYLADFKKYGLDESFWNLVGLHFGYTEAEPSLEKLAMTLLMTYAQKEVGKDLPKDWSSLISFKTGNVVVFMENIMNNIQYRSNFEAISADIEDKLKVAELLKVYPAELLLDCDVFACIDDIIIKWIVERLCDEDLGAALLGMPIPEICDYRKKKHFAARYSETYDMLTNAFAILSSGKYSDHPDAESMIKRYCDKDYLVDTYHRQFYYHYDRLGDKEQYAQLRQLVENVYTNDYLNKICVAWNEAFSNADMTTLPIPMQRRFYSRYLGVRNRAKTVVLISDALRYEVGMELMDKLSKDANCASVKIDAMFSVLPSVTKTGMAALLPHKELSFDGGKVLVDGAPCVSTPQREAILTSADKDARCFLFEDVERMGSAELAEAFKGTSVVYIYHNQIDARGDKQLTENEVYVACAEAIEELYTLLIRLAKNKVVSHFLITADHGFIYKRDKLEESDKISIGSANSQFSGRRYAVAEQAVDADGVTSYSLATILGNSDNRVVTVPIGADVFKAGGGSCYVHGGSSLQEMLVPVIEMTTKTGQQKKVFQKARISLVSILNKITNLITTLEFIQSEPVGDGVNEAQYRIFFIDAEGNKISSENVLVADKKDADAQKRITRLKFRFKDMQYNPNAKYYLVIYDEENEYTTVMKQEVRIDMAFASDFGF